MIRFSTILLIFSAALCFSSCTKVIDLNLNDTAKKYVIEGIITNEPGICQVKITRSNNYDQSNNFDAVSDAIVTIKDNNGLRVTLPETSEGLYQTNMITGNPGHSYTLSANVNGEVFTAVSKMPVRVNLDSLYIVEMALFGDTKKYANFLLKDPAGTGNSYRFILYKNSKQNKTIFVGNDDFSDGKDYNSLLISDNTLDADDIITGDTIKVAMQCIDPIVYKYWYSLNAGSTGNSQYGTPGNPVTNITGGALGYFSAHTSQSKTVIAP